MLWPFYTWAHIVFSAEAGRGGGAVVKPQGDVLLADSFVLRCLLPRPEDSPQQDHQRRTVLHTHTSLSRHFRDNMLFYSLWPAIASSLMNPNPDLKCSNKDLSNPPRHNWTKINQTCSCPEGFCCSFAALLRCSWGISVHFSWSVIYNLPCVHIFFNAWSWEGMDGKGWAEQETGWRMKFKSNWFKKHLQSRFIKCFKEKQRTHTDKKLKTSSSQISR